MEQIKSKQFVFQAIHWEGHDIQKSLLTSASSNSSGDSSSDEEEETSQSVEDQTEFIIKLFGRLITGESVSVNILKFTPYFYVSIPRDWNQIELCEFRQWIEWRIGKKHKNAFFNSSSVDTQIYYKYKFSEFTNHQKYPFTMFRFSSLAALRRCKNIFLDKEWSEKEERYIKIEPKRNIGGRYNGIQFELYESKLDHILQYLHIQNIEPSGWVRISRKHLRDSTFLESNHTVYNLEVDWKYVKPTEDTRVAPMVLASFDIECDSSHGDFPLSKKSWDKYTTELIQLLFKKQELQKLTTQYCRKLFRSTLKDALRDTESSPVINSTISKIYLQLNQSYEADDELFDQFEQFGIKLLNYYESKTNSIAHNNRLERFFQKQSITANKVYIIQDRKNMIREWIPRMNRFFRSKQLWVKGDIIIQIGTAFQKVGDTQPYCKYISTVDTCDPIPNVEVESYKTEEECILGWIRKMKQENPDIVTGYNIYNFDYMYIAFRCQQLDLERSRKGLPNLLIEDTLYSLGRLDGIQGRLLQKTQSSAAMGISEQKILVMPGRCSLDLLKYVRDSFNFGSYRLDAVASHFIRGHIDVSKSYHVQPIETDGVVHYEPLSEPLNKASEETTYTFLNTSSIDGIVIGNYVRLMLNKKYYEEAFMNGKKFKIVSKNESGLILKGFVELSSINGKIEWTLTKDDVSPQDIFDFQKESSMKRKEIATYCVQDCVLCLYLIRILSIIINCMGMSNVCSVPIDYIFSRGQGIKSLSTISKVCRQKQYVIPDLYQTKSSGFEGAAVIQAKPAIYKKESIAVLDYSSLYPSTMIADNLSHETQVRNSRWTGLKGGKRLHQLGYQFVDITYDIYEFRRKAGTKTVKKVNTGKQKTCRFIQPKETPDGSVSPTSRGIIPQILMSLLNARKQTRRKIKFKTVSTHSDTSFSGMVTEEDSHYTIVDQWNKTHKVQKEDVTSITKTYNELECSVWNGLQLAYKISANSIYGTTGARTSNVRNLDIAASTTAGGRKLLWKAATEVKKWRPQTDLVYGDTDSIFVNFNPVDNTGQSLSMKEGLSKTIQLGLEFETHFQQFLKYPHKLEYEKTFQNFTLFSKKRYFGMKYEFDPNHGKETAMGIVLKRRDNANIVKVVYGGILDLIKKQASTQDLVDYTNNCLEKLVSGQYPMDMLIISKTLKPASAYSNPQGIAHWVLSERMGERDPGNKPQSNDRIPYVYIVSKNKKALQGDRIEHPDYVLEQNIPIDYEYYITNQLRKPIEQIFELIPDLDTKSVFKQFLETYRQSKSNQQLITRFF